MGVGRWASAGAGVRGRLDNVRLSLTVKVSDHCVCPESQGVPSWCCKTCIQMSVPGTASAIGLTVPGTSIKLQASLQSYPFAPREDFQVEKNSESEEIWVEEAFRSGKIAFSFFLKKPHEPSRPKPEIPPALFCNKMNTFSGETKGSFMKRTASKACLSFPSANMPFCKND